MTDSSGRQKGGPQNCPQIRPSRCGSGDSKPKPGGASQPHDAPIQASGMKSTWSAIVKSEPAKEKGEGNGLKQPSASTESMPTSSLSKGATMGVKPAQAKEPVQTTVAPQMKASGQANEIAQTKTPSQGKMPAHAKSQANSPVDKAGRAATTASGSGDKLPDGDGLSSEQRASTTDGGELDAHRPRVVKQVWKKSEDPKTLLPETGASWPSLSDSRDQPKKRRQNSIGGGSVKLPETPPSLGPVSSQQNGNGNNGVQQAGVSRRGKMKPLKLDGGAQSYKQGSQGASDRGPHHGQRRHNVEYGGSARSHRDSRQTSGGRGGALTAEGRNGGRGTRGQGGGGHGRNHTPQNARSRPTRNAPPRSGSFGSDPFFMQVPPNAAMMYVPMMPPQMFYPQAAYHMRGMGYMPQGGAVTRPQVMEAVKKQVEYYFSVENLCKDIFLRKQMDGSGWIPLLVVANFNRVRMLTPDHGLIVEALRTSGVIEVSPDGNMIRSKSSFSQWVLPGEQQHHQQEPEVQKFHAPPTMEAAINTVESGVTKCSSVKGEEDDVFMLDEEQSAFHKCYGVDNTDLPDKDLEKLIVVTQKSPGDGRTHIDKRLASLINDGLTRYEQELQQHHWCNGGKQPGGGMSSARFYCSSMPKGGPRGHNSLPSNSVGWLMGTTPDTSGGTTFGGRSQGTSPVPSSLSSSVPIPKFDHPSHALLKDNGFRQMKYERYHQRCLKDREMKGKGKSDEINTLFCFWSYFLRENFNLTMYLEFQKMAAEDQESGNRCGTDSILRFYSYGLEKKFRPRIYKDFEDLTIKDYEAGSLYGLEKFWAFHHYGGIPEGFDLEIHPKLKKLLDSQFSTLVDFKKEHSRRQQASQSSHQWHRSGGLGYTSLAASIHMDQEGTESSGCENGTNEKMASGMPETPTTQDTVGLIKMSVPAKLPNAQVKLQEVSVDNPAA